MASQTAAPSPSLSAPTAEEGISLFRRAQAEWARTPARRPVATPAFGDDESDANSLSSEGTVRITAPPRLASRSSSFCDSVLSSSSSSASVSSGSSWETLSSSSSSSSASSLADEEVVTTIGVAGRSASWRSGGERSASFASFSFSSSSSSDDAGSTSSVADSSASLRSVEESARAAAEAICAGLAADVASGKQRFSELEGRVEGLVVKDAAKRERRKAEAEEKGVRVVLRGYVPVAREGGVCGREWVRGFARGGVGEGAYPSF